MGAYEYQGAITPTTNIAVISGDGQMATVCTTLAPFTVQVTNTNGNPIAGHLVHWTIVDAPATAGLSATVSTTGADGMATTTLTLGTKSGTYRVTVHGSTQATFTATTTPDTVSRIIMEDLEGIETGTKTLTSGDRLPLYLRGYDNYRNETIVSGDWTVFGRTGTCTPAYGTATVFKPTRAASYTTRVSARYGTLTDSTGAINITPGQIASIKAVDYYNREIGTMTLTADGTQTLYLKGYDADNNPIYVAGTWTVHGGIGICTPEYGTSTVFNPTLTGTGTISVHSAQYEAMTDTTGIITVNAGSLFSVEVSATPTTILRGGSFTLTIIPKDRDGNVILSTGRAAISNLTRSISPTQV